MDPAALTRMLQEFFAPARSAAVLERGEELFIFAEGEDSARYSVSGDDRKCLLHLWSAERNLVRRVLDAQLKSESLALSVQRFGRSQPAKLEIVRDRDRRSATARRQARLAYARALERALARDFPGFTVSRFTSAMDLERSFGAVYARGTLARGRSRFAVLGVNPEESQAAVDGSLTFALLWLERCREKSARHALEGVKLILPRGRTAVVRERMACLDQAAAKFHLYEQEERGPALAEVDGADRGNLETRLTHAVDSERAHQRFAGAIAQALALTPAPEEVELLPTSPAEIGLRLHGLEFARIRLLAQEGKTEISFGAGRNRTLLTAESEGLARAALAQLFRARQPGADPRHPLFRMQPERWLEAQVRKQVAAIDSELTPQPLYSQAPTFSASDRGMMDLLAVTRADRLTVLELKADEDIHLPLQGLDYWARVAWHHARGEFPGRGYFPGRQLAARAPRLLLVAPALRLHPATDVLLRYLSPEVEWELVGVDERWREQLKVVFRKRRPPPLP